MTTKKQAAARKAAWTKALAEGRVVRYDKGARFQSFKTAEVARQTVARCVADGMDAEIVTPPEAAKTLGEIQ